MVFGKFKQHNWNKKLVQLHKKMKYHTLPGIHKRSGVYLENSCESTPIIVKNKLYLVGFTRESSYGMAIVIYEFFSKKLVKNIPWNYGLGCAFIDPHDQEDSNSKIHIFGTSDWSQKNEIRKIILDSDFTIIENSEKKVWDAIEGQKIFNTSVCISPLGYLMAYEVSEPKTKNFSIRFLQSKDLEHWESIGTIFHPDVYAACPTIRYNNGYYYILYLRQMDAYVTFIARTRDFFEFEDFSGNETYDNYTQVLSPKGKLDECTNTSDIDLVEYNGNVIFVYADGDQNTWSNIRTAVYFGTLNELFSAFWKD